LKKRSATARPIPEAAPVMIATLPLKRSFMRDPQVIIATREKL
jgi:hypothetical protein